MPRTHDTYLRSEDNRYPAQYVCMMRGPAGPTYVCVHGRLLRTVAGKLNSVALSIVCAAAVILAMNCWDPVDVLPSYESIGNR
jgi:hypothetical protein